MKRKDFLAFGFFVFAFAFIAVFFAGVLSAQTPSDQIPGLPSGIGVNQIEAANGQIVNISSNLGYLGQEWQKILFSNPTFKWIDGALHTINPVFKVAMAQDYALSISFFITLVVWLFLFLSFNNILKNFLFVSKHSKLVSITVAILLAVLLAQTGLIGWISNLILWFVFGQKSVWMQILLGIVTGLILALVFLFITKFGAAFAKARQERKDEENRMKLEAGARVGEEVARATEEG